MLLHAQKRNTATHLARVAVFVFLSFACHHETAKTHIDINAGKVLINSTDTVSSSQRSRFDPMFDKNAGIELAGGGHQVQFMEKSPYQASEMYTIDPAKVRKLP